MPYIYCLSNPAMPGLLKFGAVHINDKTVKDRAAELFTSGVPEEFHIEFFAAVSDSRGTEARIHSLLDKYRNKNSREFFRIGPEEAKHIIEQHIPELTWGDKDAMSSNKVSKSAYIRLNALYKVVSDDVNVFVTMMKNTHKLRHSYESKCNGLLERLGYIHDGLTRMNDMTDKESREFPYRNSDNAYMKRELYDIQHDLEKLKENSSSATHMKCQMDTGFDQGCC